MITARYPCDRATITLDSLLEWDDLHGNGERVNDGYYLAKGKAERDQRTRGIELLIYFLCAMFSVCDQSFSIILQLDGGASRQPASNCFFRAQSVLKIPIQT